MFIKKPTMLKLINRYETIEVESVKDFFMWSIKMYLESGVGDDQAVDLSIMNVRRYVEARKEGA